MKLVHGAGSPTKGACWMSAIKWYAHPESAWGDDPECVDPVIKQLCISLNDHTPEEEMESFIGPHLFAPLGTNMGDEISIRRSYRCTDWAVREILPHMFRSVNMEAHVENLVALDPIIDKATAHIAMVTVRELRITITDTSDYHITDAVRCAINAENHMCVYEIGNAAVHAAIFANKYAAMVADIPGGCYLQSLLGLILELCEMGREDINTTRTKEQTVNCLNKGCFVEETTNA